MIQRKDFCNDLKIAVYEFQKEIDEHKITDEKTLKANEAMEDAYGYFCTSMKKPDCKALQDGVEIWREEINKYSNLDILTLDIKKMKFPVIPLFGWILGKGSGYYKRVQDGVDSAFKSLSCNL